jgi:hypothetical protein
MSTLKVNTLTDTAATKSVPIEDVVNGVARAWVNFNGTTSPINIRASYNVSSITDNGVGNYTVNFTNAFADTNYAWCGNWGSNSAAAANQASVFEYGTRSTSHVNILTTGSNTATLGDRLYVMLSIFR